ncbi:hypothetical protein AN478_09875 [Thiohalorhabdus denitrificans]|uniref:Uncharacterized protein n=1 Tax=Thiohalorhabdus denitrificans TaxID=381306 RepID=A0A0P9C3C3_9GAMM|nr:hypothetical protein [Thiohalorhabdus denitrificans]KPV39467.1 hypothetical protein AN478_09875 [Thiohalorhabdus denitrificans]SCY01833.1 hypothetical protein SAMN05661077_1062 [Thiohalorhabdus denitrificans]
MSEFAERYWGSFTGCIRWEQAEAVAERLAATEGPWYVVSPEEGAAAAVEELAPTEAAERLGGHLAEMQRLKKGPYCNLAFVDDAEDPRLIKLFHPKRAGDACRVGGDPIPPWVVLSRYPVDPAVFAPAREEPQGSWWQRMIRIGSPD